MAVRARLARVAARDGAVVVLCAVFVAYAAVLLGTLQYNFDEGVYIQQALRILRGQLPYRDFFYHQTPLYPFTLAAFGALLPHTVFVFRLPSLLATAASGVFVYLAAGHLMPRAAAAAATALFYFVPLQFYGLLALPLGVMQLACTAGTYLLLFGRARAAVCAGAALLLVSVLYRPISLSVCLAGGICLLAIPRQRWKIVWAGLTGLVTAAAAWAVFHAVSDGAFTDMLVLQLSRYATKGGFDQMMQYEPFRRIAHAAGVGSAIGWNVNEHETAFFGMGVLNGNLWFLGLSIAGQLMVWGPRGHRWSGRRLLLTLWWAVPLAFSIYVWEPIWDHYCIQYVPPLAILGALVLHRLWGDPRRRLTARVGAGALLSLVVALGAAGVIGRRGGDFGNPTHALRPGETWLTFDPFLNFVTRTEPACGLIDPFNVYGSRSLVAMSPSPALSQFYTGPDDVIRCLDEHPDAKVALGTWTGWFVDDRLRAYVRGLPRERVAGEWWAH